MENGIIIAAIKGICIGVFLTSIDLEIDNPSWWVSVIALNIAFAL